MKPNITNGKIIATIVETITISDVIAASFSNVFAFWK